MNREEREVSDEPDDGQWLRVWYQTERANVQWAKEQGWRSLQWVVILFVAIAAAADRLTHLWIYYFFGTAVVVGAVAIMHQIDLHRSAKESRETSERIVSTVPHLVRYLPERSKAQHHFTYLVIQLTIIAAAFIFTILDIQTRR